MNELIVDSELGQERMLTLSQIKPQKENKSNLIIHNKNSVRKAKRSVKKA